ncbi:LA_2272 family surface repeat-containing protein [Tenacibaculum sp. MEBiC06402]|uniref:LA_2272 family surface repeat-containing protein n=1 Tax=unclassified Tenacibaculum TaxID=2635139 RepID=UPI003B98EBCA
MKRSLTILITLFTFLISHGQDEIVIKKGVIGTFHTENKIINGLSFGLYSGMNNDRNVITNGLRIEVPGIGMLSFMGNGLPNATEPFDLTDYKYSEVINGLNLSSGSWCDCNYNGLTIGFVGQYGKLGNGFSLAGGWNIIDKQNGLQLAIITNSSYYMNGIQLSAFNYSHDGAGIQVGILNHSNNFKGIQFGIWNVNQKRKLPLINWNF